MHTSTVTVAVIDPNIVASDVFSKRSDDDFRVEWFAGTGNGGQHKNKHQNSCRLIHIPTGIMESRQGRERLKNMRDAKEAILAKLDSAASSEVGSTIASDRKIQVGSGMRGDKRRTYRFQDDQVVDHFTNKSANCREVMKGKIDLLW